MEIKIQIYRLTFTAPLHIANIRSDYGQSEKRIHSDTLYAAICQAWALLGKKDFSENLGFAISSLFPFARDISNQPVYFFPKPFSLPKKHDDNQDSKDAKKLKKIEFLDKDYFQEFLYGTYHIKDNTHVKSQYLTAHDFSEQLQTPKKENLKKGEFYKLKLYVSQVVPRIRWSRDETKDAEPFYLEKIYFKTEAGLWFMFIPENEHVTKEFEKALKLLSEEGLGSDRNLGNGKFTFEKDTLTLKTPAKTDYCISLSLFCPENPESLKSMLYKEKSIDEKIGYEFLKRGGWISEPFITYRKKSIYMFQEASVFRLPENLTDKGYLIKGVTADVTPDIVKNQYPERKIYRTGKAIFLPVKF